MRTWHDKNIQYHFGFSNRKSKFQASIVSAPSQLWATFWEFCLEHTKYLEKINAQNQINRLNTLKNELPKVFRVFGGFVYALWQKAKTWKCRKPTESFLNQKPPSFKALPLLENCYKAINLLSTYHFDFNNRKSQFKLQ